MADDFDIKRAKALETVYQAGKMPPEMKRAYEIARPHLLERVQDEERTLGSALGEAVESAPRSALNAGKDFLNAVTDPVGTVKAIGGLAAGSLEKLAEKIGVPAETISTVNQKLGISEDDPKLAEQFWTMQKERYGGWKEIKKTIATDPVGFLFDASTLFGGAGGLLQKATKVGSAANKVGRAASKVGEVTNPLNLAKKPAELAGKATAIAAGDFASRAGHESITEAYRAGEEGGSKQATFSKASREELLPKAIVNMGLSAVDKMRQQKLSDYARDIQSTQQSTKRLVWTDIIKAITDAEDRATHTAKLNPNYTKVIDKVGYKKIQEIQQLVSKDFYNGANTASDFDKLKQEIGKMMESLPEDEKAAYAAIKPIYDAIKATIIRQVPAYGGVMKAYEEMTETINEIERTLSLGKKATVDTGMRKLMSIMRNNVNTSFGQRAALLEELEKYGAKDLKAALAGLELSSYNARGLGGTVAGWEALRYMTSTPEQMWVLPLLLLASPKIVGQVANKAGMVSRGLKPLLPYNNAVYQGGKLEGMEQDIEQQEGGPSRITVHPRAPADVLNNPGPNDGLLQ